MTLKNVQRVSLSIERTNMFDIAAIFCAKNGEWQFDPSNYTRYVTDDVQARYSWIRNLHFVLDSRWFEIRRILVLDVKSNALFRN